MRTSMLWVEKINFPDNGDNCVYDICFSPDGTQMIAAVGLRILVINVAEGTVIQALKGHKGTVYCCSYAYDGKRFATGGSDKSVVIWTNALQGALKYSHNDSIQCLAYNPSSQQLASCSANDFGLWSPEKKSVDKYKVTAKINACAWTADGLYLALGLSNGTVTIRNKAGAEHSRIERPGGSNSAVWGIAWGRTPEDGQDMLCVADWGQCLSFYSLMGKQVMKDRSLGFDPLRVVYAHTHRDCEYIIVTGSNKASAIFTQEGIKVTSVAEQESWVWACVMKPNSSSMAVGTQGGIITLYEIQLLVVHALYKSLYAYRMNMTDVMVQDLLKDLRVRIKCRDVVKKLAIFKDNLAIQFSDRVLIYQREGKNEDFKYHLKDKISQTFECSLLVMCMENLILCHERKLQCLSFTGVRLREWILESHIRYIRSVGGKRGKEVLIAGLKNGQVVKVFLDNPFPIVLAKAPQSVRCVDLNLLHTKLAVVDESSTLFVYDLTSKDNDLLFQEPNAISVFWNTICDDLLSYSGFGTLNIKANGFPVHQQKMAGFVVGFCGHKIFSMQNSSVVTLEVPLSGPLYQYIQHKEFREAYKIASLGVPINDWKELANAALAAMDLEIARKAFAKTKNLQFVRLLAAYEERLKRDQDVKPNSFLADVYAHQGRFAEAARLYKDCGEEHKAMAMYADLRLFDLAQEYLGGGDSVDKTELMKRKAEWAAKINEPRAAAEMYLVAGEKLKAIEIMAENQWTDMLMEVGRKLDRADEDALNACAGYLAKMGQVSAAAEMYRRVGLVDKVAEMYVLAKEWQEAFIIVEKHPELRKLVYLPYAQWLAERDQFTEAQKAFHEAGCPEEAFRVLELLKRNAVEETRYHDAGYFHWVLSMQYLDLVRSEKCTDEERQENLATFVLHQKKAAMYYAYNSIYRYTTQPFTPFLADALFNISRFLMHELMTETDLPISKFHVLYTLAKQARTLKACKLARHVLERLQSVRVPPTLREGLDLLCLTARGDPFSDNEELLPLCYRCSTTNPLLNPRGNYCINCYHPFVFSFVSFEVLPLVEFQLEDGISDEEALGLIGSRLPGSEQDKGRSRDKWKESMNEDVQVLHFDNDEAEEEAALNHDPFSVKAMGYDGGNGTIAPVIVDRDTLRGLEPTEVIVCKWQPPLRYQFYKNLLPDMSISQCHACFKMFHTDDFVLQVLQKGHCPFCRSPPLEETRPVLPED